MDRVQTRTDRQEPSGRFPGRLAIQQRVLPAYRAPFFELLAAASGSLSVFAGEPVPEENVVPARSLSAAQYVPARNINILPFRSPFYQCWQAGLLDWLEDWQPDVLVVEANTRYPNSPRAIRWMHAHGRPVLGWGLGAPPISGPLAAARSRSRQSLVRSLDGVIAYSQRGAEEYIRLGLPEDRVFVAANAAAPRPADPLPERAPGFHDRPVVLFVGRLQRRKRIDNLLHACAALPSEQQPRLVVVGEGPARAEFQATAAQVYPNAEFTGARLGPALEPYFKEADLFVLPGTGGLAVQQAMSFGLPVIVAQGDGTQDDLVRPGNGWLIPPDDLPALTRTLREALSDAARLRRMGAEAYRIVSEEANLEIMVQSFIRAVNHVFGR